MACEDRPTMLHACSGPSDGMLWFGVGSHHAGGTHVSNVCMPKPHRSLT